MDKMSGSPSLNPASTPFFPGGGGQLKEDDGKPFGAILHRHNSRERFRASSSLSASPSEYRSLKSSPSPPQDASEYRVDPSREYSSSAELSRRSPANAQQADNDKPFALTQRPIARESSMSAIMEVPPEGEDPASLHTANGFHQHTLYSSVIGRMRDRLTTTPPVSVEMGSSMNSRTPSFTSAQTHFISSSPASSLDSGSLFTSSVDLSASFDAQLRSSPLIREILERVDNLERTTRDIQRTVGDVDRKMTILIERTITANSPPEFRDPFAPSSAPSFAAPTTNGLISHRGSIIGNVAPNQAPPSEDVMILSQQMNALTTTLDQVLAAQQAQGTNGSLQQALGPQSNDFMSHRSSGVITPNGGPGSIGIGIPGRTGPRVPGPPMRTWSAGTLDLPMRSSEQLVGSIGRADSNFRDKRRSVSTLLRRDSAATDTLSATSRDSTGPMITKWEQLALAPELLRSLNTFGVGPPNKIQQRALPFLLRGADIIAQAPPTQERIAAYVIPAIHIAITNATGRGQLRGPFVVMISTTVDQATQAQRMIRDLGGPIGVRSALGVGASSVNSDLSQELRLLHQNMPHILCGTPQKLHALFTSPGGISGSEVRFLVLDEVDQLIARNLQDFVFNIVRQLPAPRSRPVGPATPTLNQGNGSSLYSMFDGNGSTSSLNTPGSMMNARRFSTITSSPPDISNGTPPPIDRQTALFSNTVPQDVLNLATAIQLREPIRVLVRRDGNVSHTDSSGQNARGLRQFYLYLAFTASGGRSDTVIPTGGTGIIGSGRGASSAESAQAREWKLDALADLFEDLEITQAIIHVGGMTSLETVVYRLAQRGLEPVPLHNDMNAGTKLAALNKFRNPSTGMMRQPSTKVLVVYDVMVKAPDVPQVPLVINYDLPKAVEEYAHRVAPATAASFSRPGVVVNFVTATGGDVEMLRSIECFYKIKCPEVPMSLRDLL